MQTHDDAAATVFTVVIDGNPGQLKINNAKKAVVIKGKARLVDVGTVRKAKVSAEQAVAAAMSEQPYAATAVSSATTLVVEIDCYWPRVRRLDGVIDLPLGDVDGPLKLTIDALTHAGLIDDDVRVTRVVGRKFVDRERPRIEMRVWPA